MMKLIVVLLTIPMKNGWLRNAFLLLPNLIARKGVDPLSKLLVSSRPSIVHHISLSTHPRSNVLRNAWIYLPASLFGIVRHPALLIQPDLEIGSTGTILNGHFPLTQMCEVALDLPHLLTPANQLYDFFNRVSKVAPRLARMNFRISAVSSCPDV